MYFLHCLDLKDSFQLSLSKTKLHFVSRAWNMDEAELGSEQQIIDAQLLEAGGAVINPNYSNGQVVICELLSKKYYMSNE